MGMLLLQTMLASGASVVDVVDISEDRLSLATEFGAARTIVAGKESPAQSAYDLVVDATGNVEVIEQ
jgi:threonine dehydrogenase-like Zn-dependent dehydrogenase